MRGGGKELIFTLSSSSFLGFPPTKTTPPPPRLHHHPSPHHYFPIPHITKQKKRNKTSDARFNGQKKERTEKKRTQNKKKTDKRCPLSLSLSLSLSCGGATCAQNSSVVCFLLTLSHNPTGDRSTYPRHAGTHAYTHTHNTHTHTHKGPVIPQSSPPKQHPTMSTSSPGVVKKPAGGTGLLGRFKKGNSKDLKKLAKEGGEAAFQGYLKKYKEKDGEWKSRWVEIRGGCLMWCSSKGGGRSDFKDFLELQGARLIDEASLFGLDSLGQARAKASAMVYSVEKGKTRNLGTMKDKMALSRDYSFRIVPKNGQPHIFAADGDHDKEEWWRHILRAINSVSGIEESGTAKAVLEDIPLFSDAKPQSIPRNQVEFDFLSVVGKGAYGRVIKVREKATGNIYVCKVLIKQAILRHRMLREVKKEQALLQQVSHPYIVDLISAFQTRDKIFLVMEFLCGGELFSHMTAEKTKRCAIKKHKHNQRAHTHTHTQPTGSASKEPASTQASWCSQLSTSTPSRSSTAISRPRTASLHATAT